MLGNLQDLLKAEYHRIIERLRERKFDLLHKVEDIAEILIGDYEGHLVTVTNPTVPMNHRQAKYFFDSMDYHTKVGQYLDGTVSVDQLVKEIKPHFRLVFDAMLEIVKEGSREAGTEAYKSRYIPITILSAPDSRLREGAESAKTRMIEIRNEYKEQ